jgi:hypothetical protein
MYSQKLALTIQLHRFLRWYLHFFIHLKEELIHLEL